MDTPTAKLRSIRPFPWGALPIVPREAASALRDVRRAMATAIDPARLGEELSTVLTTPVRVQVNTVNLVIGEPPPFGGAIVALGTPDGAIRVELELDTELARTMVGRIIGRPARLAVPRAALEHEVEGALVAILLRVTRRAHGAATPLVPMGRGSFRREAGERRLSIDATIAIDREAFAVRVVVDVRKTLPPPNFEPLAMLSSLGRLPISLPLIAASSLVATSELLALSVGDIWMPGGGWTAQLDRGEARLVGEGILAPPASDRGIAVKLGEAGEIVLVGRAPLPIDVEKNMQNSHQDQTATSEIALDAPLVVRVEVGGVTLPASEWAALGPGDVIALGRRINEPVVLRIAGTEVARGELVDIEGELGVRIREKVVPT